MATNKAFKKPVDGTVTIDLLYRIYQHQKWNLLDFHSGSLKDKAAAKAAYGMRRAGLLEKCRAVHTQLGGSLQFGVYFLDVAHQVVIYSEGFTNETQNESHSNPGE